MNHPFRLKNAALLMALAAAYPMHVQAASGVAQFAVGDVSLRRGSTTQVVNRGAQIQSGDSITTGNASQTQIRFSDGGLVSLAPNSQFNIDKYVDENKPDQDGFFATLLRGGMRAITGLVGKRNHDNYQIKTTTATIGIRGSAFSANYNPDGSLNVAGEQDGIVVCTNAGCVNLVVGEAVRVTDNDSVPGRTIERSNVPPLVARQDLFEPENPLNIQPISLPQQNLVNGVLTGVSALFAFDNGYLDNYPRGGQDPSNGVGTFVDGLMTRHTGTAGEDESSIETVQKTGSLPGTFGTVGSATDADFAGWGYWDAGSVGSDSVAGASNGEDSQLPGVHYVVGRPTPLASMPVTGTASYQLIGGTTPTAAKNGSLLTGSLVSAGLNVDFGAARVNAFVNTLFTVGGQNVPVQVAGYGNIVGNRFTAAPYDNTYDYYYGGDSLLYGFFIGPQATRAGMVYQGYDDGVGTVQGAAVFLKGGAGLAFSQQGGMSAMFGSTDGTVDDGYPRGGINPSTGIGYFVGNQLYLHDDGEDSGGGYGGSSYLATSGPVSSAGSIGNPSDADFIGWGYWAKGTVQSYYDDSGLTGVHYLVGRPTPYNQMPASGSATYSMIGGTVPTATYQGTTIMGRLLGATMSVDFSNQSASATINTDFQKSGATVPVTIQNTNMYVNGAWLCGGNINGFFTGNQATRAGLLYRKDTGTNLGVVRGAVGLQRGPITGGVQQD